MRYAAIPLLRIAASSTADFAAVPGAVPSAEIQWQLQSRAGPAALAALRGLRAA